MRAKRIIPCLDIKNGKTVKGINFLNVKDVGDPVELGIKYANEGADELAYLDITASLEKRKLFTDLVSRIAANINIPFIVGGGISELADVEILLNSGADKISVNTAAYSNKGFVEKVAASYGSKSIIVAIDARLEDGTWYVYISGGKVRTDRELLSYAKEMQEKGAGEILFTSMSHDGTKNGFPCSVIAELSDTLSIPVIASGGAGKLEHFVDVFTIGKADAALAASVFHYNEIPIPVLKQYLRENEINVR